MPRADRPSATNTRDTRDARDDAEQILLLREMVRLLGGEAPGTPASAAPPAGGGAGGRGFLTSLVIGGATGAAAGGLLGGALGPGLGQAFATIGATIGSVTGTLVNAFKKLAEIIPLVGGALGTFIGALGTIPAAIVSFLAALKATVTGFHTFARSLAEASPSQAITKFREDLADFFRNMRIGQATAQTSQVLSDAFTRLKDSAEPLIVAMVNLGNRFAAFAVDKLTAVVKVIPETLLGILPAIRGMFETVAGIIGALVPVLVNGFFALINGLSGMATSVITVTDTLIKLGEVLGYVFVKLDQKSSELAKGPFETGLAAMTGFLGLPPPQRAGGTAGAGIPRQPGPPSPFTPAVPQKVVDLLTSLKNQFKTDKFDLAFDAIQKALEDLVRETKDSNAMKRADHLGGFGSWLVQMSQETQQLYRKPARALQ